MNNESLDESLDENLDKSLDKSLDKRITDILGDVKEGGLTKDSIAMVICLEDEIDKLDREIDLATSIITLIKDKKVFATYEGDRNKYFDVNQFRLFSNRE